MSLRSGGTYPCLVPPDAHYPPCACEGIEPAGRHPSVTTVLDVLSKPALIQWAANCAADEAPAVLRECDGIGSASEAADVLCAERRRIASAHTRQRDAAAARGSTVHRIVQALAEGRDPAASDLTPEVLPYLSAMRTFCAEQTPRVAHAEATVMSSRHGYAGTLDAIHHIGNTKRLVIRDWKTRKDEKRARLYGEEVLQLAAYRYADWMIAPDGTARPMPRVHAAEVVLLWPDGYRIEHVDAGRAALRVFLHALEIWRWRNAPAKGATDGI